MNSSSDNQSASNENQGNRRDFLTGRSLRDRIEKAGKAVGDALLENAGAAPEAGATLRMATRAMACEFGLVLNPEAREHIMPATDALELVHPLEDQLTVYREHSEMSQLNATAFEQPVSIKQNLFDLLQRSRKLTEETSGAFDPTSGPLIALWRQAKSEDRLPTEDEIAACQQYVGMQHVNLNAEETSVQYSHSQTELNLGSIGKGYALDEIATELQKSGVNGFLLHGGQSTLLAKGEHNGQPGWPIGLRNPLLTNEKLATILLNDRALSTSGSNVQFHRYKGRRYGHILDPRTGWPVDHLLSVSVLAPTAEQADALSTAFFVMGVEKTSQFCDNHPEIGAILIPPPQSGRQINPILLNVPDDVLYITPPNLPASDV